jgi:curved DNA-binding protein CbpA
MNYYELLEVSPTADLRTITRAWKKQLQRWHPDRNSSPNALERSKRINVAYDVLKDAAKRTAYDRTLASISSSRRRSTAGASPSKAAHTAANDPNYSKLAWDDVSFVVGHWYATREGRLYEVIGLDAVNVRVRYASGTTGTLLSAKRWQEWEDFVDRHRPDSPVARARQAAADEAKRQTQERSRREEAERAEAERRHEAEAARRDAERRAHWEALEREWRAALERTQRDAEARRQAEREAAEQAQREAEERARREAYERAEQEDAERKARETAERARHEAVRWEVQLIAFSAGPAAAAYFLQDAGWVSLQDNRDKGGLLHIFATTEAQDEVDEVMQELQDLGLPFKSAPRKTPNGTVKAWWMPRRASGMVDPP